MRDGKHEDGSMVLRAKIDMASPNINMRDPAIYRIRRATHHNTGDTWCIYPMYTYAHPIEDALEQITHSLCTLEFEDQRPFYDWLLERLTEGGLLASPPPRQYEFARLNLTYVITSKRKLAQLVYDHKVSGWDDPRMPTIVGLRRRGYTPAALQMFAERIGVTKSDSWIDYGTLEGCLREDLEAQSPPRHGRHQPRETGADQLGRRDGRRATWSPAPCPPCPTRRMARLLVQRPKAQKAPCATSPSAKKSGSNAKTLKKCPPRATSACSPATRCA